ncbi:MAG: hypothetical protein IPJ43_10070 [Saprospiraceae bacterium]|nr:hypothetical protein [Saprospiraceae bacterium]
MNIGIQFGIVGVISKLNSVAVWARECCISMGMWECSDLERIGKKHHCVRSS